MAVAYISHPQGIDDIPNFVSARSPRALRLAMLRNNTKHKGFVVYQDIQWVDADQRWYAWFYVRAEEEIMNGELDGTAT